MRHFFFLLVVSIFLIPSQVRAEVPLSPSPIPLEEISPLDRIAFTQEKTLNRAVNGLFVLLMAYGKKTELVVTPAFRMVTYEARFPSEDLYYFASITTKNHVVEYEVTVEKKNPTKWVIFFSPDPKKGIVGPKRSQWTYAHEPGEWVNKGIQLLQ